MDTPFNDEWEDFWDKVATGEIKLPVATVRELFLRARRNFNRYVSAIGTEAIAAGLLDYEASNDVPQQDVEPASPQSVSDASENVPDFESYASAGANSFQPLLLKIIKKVGRASIYRARAAYFVPSDEPVSQEEARERNQRGAEANHRRARRQAADIAMGERCHTWVTLTFDDQHRTDRPDVAFRRFLRRLRERYKRKTGKSLKYVCVVGLSPDGREHVHGLFSEDVDPDDVRECWQEGFIDEVVEIHPDEVETKVRYMGTHVTGQRVTLERFLHSRSEGVDVEVIPVRDVDEGRMVLADLIHPLVPRVVRTHLFGPHTSVGFRFTPIRIEDELILEEDER